MTDALAAFLLARIAEVEDLAREAMDWKSRRWRQATQVGDEYNYAVVIAGEASYGDLTSPADDVIAFCGRDEGSEEVARHIVRHDPARVLTECKAKRELVELCSEWLAWFKRTDVWGGWPDIASKERAEDILELLALPYASHPDYRDEWRP